MALILEKHLEKTPGIRNGKPHIIGTRITVSDIVVWHFRIGLSLEEIAVKYDLSLSAVYAAVSYYYDHKKEIDLELTSAKAFYESSRESSPSLLRDALDSMGDE